MNHFTATAHRRCVPCVFFWAALALALALVVIGPAALAWASNGGGITIEPSPASVFASGSSLTATFTTDGALYANTPLTVSFVSSTSGATIHTTYTILSAAGTTYTASIAIPNLAPGQYILIIEGPEINAGQLTSNPILVAAPTPTPLPTPALVPIGTQPHVHVVPPAPGISGGVVATAVAGLLLAVGLALLIVSALRRRGNQSPR